MTSELPTYHNIFIGRQYHLHAIVSLLQSENKRLVTLLGPGGIGKTRLAVKVGELLAGAFDHGICFVPLDVVSDPEQVPLYIGHRFGLKASVYNTWIEQIIDFLRDKQLLLILDNLEQVLQAADTIAQLLDNCPSLKILVTSREVLGLPQEVEYPLDSLNRPNSRLFPRPEDLLKFDAINLFVQKAQSSQPRFKLDRENAPAVVEICQELEGLPLPIELAAARIKLFSPNLILKKLKKSTELLKTRSMAVIHRHQNIRNTIQWSFDLLDEQEQQLFQQLSLFRGGFTPDSLEVVCPDRDALDVIESFLNKSLIVKDKEVADKPRFRMLKLIRDFGQEKLLENLQADHYYQLFSGYFIQLLETLDAHYRLSEPTTWTMLVEAEYENIGVALDWLTINQPQRGARLGACFWRYHLSRSFLREGMEMIRKLLSLSIEDSSIRARLLEGAGTLSHNLGNHLDAKTYLSRCMELWKALHNKSEILKTLNNLAWVEWRIGNYDHSVSYSNNALEIAKELHDLQGQAKALNNLAWVLFFRGQYEETAERQREVLAIHQQSKNLRGTAFAQTNLSWALIWSGKFPEARELVHQAIQTFDELKDQQMMTFSRLVKADWHLENDNLDAAKKILAQNCLPNFEKIGDAWALAYTHCRLGKINLWEENPDMADKHLNQSLRIFHHSYDQVGQAHAYLWLSKLHWENGSCDTANKELRQCLEFASIGKNYDLLTSTYLELGKRAIRQDQYTTAIAYLAVADHFCEKQGNYQIRQFQKAIAASLKEISKAYQSDKKILDKQKISEGWKETEEIQHLANSDLQFPDRISKLLKKFTPSSPTIPTAKTSPVQFTEPEDPFVKKVRLVVETHLQDTGFSVEDLSQALNLSTSQLHRKIKSLTGLSSGKYIRHIRLQKACELLKDPELTNTAIAIDTGFRDVDYFYRVFKQTFDITPGEFRKVHTSSEP